MLLAVLPHLARHYRITWMGVGYKGPELRLLDDVVVRPTNLNGGDLVGAYEARLTWESLAADAVLALNDVWYLAHYSRELARVLGPVPMIGYLPLDGDIPDPRLVEELVGFQSLFTYTAHAAGELERALRACGHTSLVGVAGHGVDVETFRPADAIGADRGDARARIRLAQALFGLAEPCWVALNASRPDPRKRIDLTLEGFAAFARGRPHVRLCLHQAIAHPQFVDPLRQQAEALGIADRILWWPPAGAPLDDRALCALYNACVAGINTSVGEGFGLVSFEHGATGVPQIVPDHPALAELWGGAALRLPVTRVMTEYSPLVMGEVAADAVASALARLHDDEAEYRRFAAAAYDRCQAPDLRWPVAAGALLRGLRAAAHAGESTAGADRRSISRDTA